MCAKRQDSAGSQLLAVEEGKQGGLLLQLMAYAAVQQFVKQLRTLMDYLMEDCATGADYSGELDGGTYN